MGLGLVWLLLFWPLVWGLVGSASLPSPLPSPWPTPQPSPRPSPWPSPEPSPQPSPRPSPEPSLWPSFQPTPPPTPQPSACPCVMSTQEKGALKNLENFLVNSKVAGLRNFSDFLSCPSPVNHCSLNSVFTIDLNFTINSTTGDCFLSYFKARKSKPLVNTTGLFDALQNFGRLGGIDTKEFMAGTLPEKIGVLSSLTLFGIAEPSVSGTIPSGLYRLTNLRFLNFASCKKLSGTISEEIGNLIKLTTLYISKNSISGTLPQKLGRLTELVKVRLDKNHFDGEIPAALGALQKLTFLDVSQNSLHGSIPPQLGNLANLNTLSLDFNRLSGTISSTLERLGSLKSLSLSINNLRGSIPSEFGLLTKLAVLGLSGNQLSGSLPIYLPTNLTSLDLGSNSFRGSVPTQFGLLTKLVDLYLSGNSLNGSTLNFPPSLKYLSLYHNDFSGPCIPSIIFNLTSLTHLDLGTSNSLTWSTIPLQLGTLTNLNRLHLDDCHLVGSIPDLWQNMSKLKLFYAHNNSLNSTLPNSLMSLTGLQILSVHNNSLSGNLNLSRLKSLEEIDVGNNHLDGFLPQLNEPLRKVWLNFNSFSGSLRSLSKSLNYLNLQNNSLTGFALPSEIYGNDQLTYLNLLGNKLHGTISTQIGLLTGLKYLMIGLNDLSGTIPSQIGDLTDLRVLNASHNHLGGSIPSELGKCTGLIQVSLSQNSLRGSIPSSFANLTLLKELILYTNKITGSIPSSLASLNSLEELFLSDNLFTGSIDFIFKNGSFPSLKYLDLSHNLFGKSLFVETCPPKLKSLALYTNCFSESANFGGVCKAKELETLLLDGLSINHFCAKHIWGSQSKVLKKEWQASPLGKLNSVSIDFSSYKNTQLQATLPTCIFSMEKIQTIHAIANNLRGSLPDVLPQNLTRLRLNVNYLVGTIPSAFQIASGRMKVLDLSENRLSGSIEHMSVSRQTTNALFLDRNRLSGSISSEVASTLKRVSVLEGNLFSCDRVGIGQTRKDLPVNDPSYLSYNCGSQNLDTALYEFLAISLAIGVGLLVQIFYFDHFHRLRKLLTRNMFRSTYVSKNTRGPKSVDGESLSDHYSLGRDSTFAARLSLMPPKMRSQTVLTNLTGKLRDTVMDNLHANNYIFLLVDFRAICLFFGIAIVAFMLPLYAALKLYSNGKFSMYEKSYSWITSGAFLTGWEPATTLVVVWSFLLVAASMLFYHAFKRDSLSEREARLAQSADDLFQRHADSVKSDGEKPRPPRALAVDEEVPPSSRPNSTTIGRLVVESTEKIRDFLVSESSSPARDLLRQRIWIWARLVSRQSIIAFISCFISLTINISYVYWYSFKGLKTSDVYLIQFVFAVIKLITRNLVPWLKRQRLLHFGLSFSQLKFENDLEVLLSVFNGIVAPFLATVVTDKTCFFYYLTSPPKISAMYDLQSLAIKEIDNSYYNSTFDDQNLFVATFKTTLEFNPPFVYYYQCTSSLIRAYAPPIIYGATINIFLSTVVPFIIRVLLDWLSPWEVHEPNPEPGSAKAAAVDGDATVAAARAPRYGVRGRVRWWLLAYFPKMLRSEDEREEYVLLNVGLNWDAWSLDKYLCASGNDYIEYSYNLIDATGVLLELFVDLLILLTFGLVCPLLALVQLLGLVLTCTRWQYAIESQLQSGDENDWDMVNLDCARAWWREKSTLYRLRWMLVTLPPLFLCMFVFDIAGDGELEDNTEYKKYKPHVILTCFVALLPLFISTIIGRFAPNLLKHLARRIVRGAVGSSDTFVRSSSTLGTEYSSSIWQRPNLGMQIPRRSTQPRRSSANKNAAGGGGGGGVARASAAGAKADADAEAQPVHNPLSEDAAQTGIELADIIPAPVEAEPEPEQAVVSSLSDSPPRRLRPDDNQQQI